MLANESGVNPKLFQGRKMDEGKSEAQERRGVGEGKVLSSHSGYNFPQTPHPSAFLCSHSGVRGLCQKIFEILHANLYILVFLASFWERNVLWRSIFIVIDVPRDRRFWLMSSK